LNVRDGIFRLAAFFNSSRFIKARLDAANLFEDGRLPAAEVYELQRRRIEELVIDRIDLAAVARQRQKQSRLTAVGGDGLLHGDAAIRPGQLFGVGDVIFRRCRDHPQRVAAEQSLLIKKVERQQAAGFDLMIEVWQSIQLALRFEAAHRDAFELIIASFQCGEEFLYL
jgi:hypothetical protein